MATLGKITVYKEWNLVGETQLIDVNGGRSTLEIDDTKTYTFQNEGTDALIFWDGLSIPDMGTVGGFVVEPKQRAVYKRGQNPLWVRGLADGIVVNVKDDQ